MIYDNKSYLSDTAKGSKSYALYHLERYINQLEGLFKTSLRINGKYKFQVDRNHYSRLNCMLAKQFRKDGTRIKVYDNNGELWLITDYSLNIDETETVNKKTATKDMDNVINPFLNDLKDNRHLLPSQELDMHHKLMGVVYELGSAIKANTEGIGFILKLITPKKDGEFKKFKKNRKPPDYIN